MHNLLPSPVFLKLKRKYSRYLFFDVVVRDNKLILIGSYYPDIEFDFNKIKIYINNIEITEFQDIGYPGPEQVRAIIYELNDHVIGSIGESDNNQILLKVIFQNQEYEFFISNVNQNKLQDFKKKSLAIATLFAENDFENLESFITYYRNQGIEYFFLYYNGNLSKLQSEKPEVFGIQDVFFGEWNFPYFLEVSFITKFVWRGINRIKLIKRIFNYFKILNFTFNHAQMSFLTMVRYRFLPNFSHILFIDIDERIYYPEGTLKDYLHKNNPVTEVVKSYWAEEKGYIRDYSKKNTYNSTKLLANTYHNSLHGVKTIYRGDYQGLIRVHFPASDTSDYINWSHSLKLYHLANLRNRRGLVKGQIEEVFI